MKGIVLGICTYTTTVLNSCMFAYYRNKLYEIASEAWGQVNDEMRHKMSTMASAAAWGLGQWESMEDYVHSVPRNTMIYPFLQSILKIHHGEFAAAQTVSH